MVAFCGKPFMPILQQIQRDTVRAVLAGAVLVLPLLAATPTHAEVIRAADMLQGVTITQPQCAAVPDTVWVKVFGRPFCVRYYISSSGGEGRRPVVFLQGDKFGKLDGRTRSFYETEKFKDVDTDNLAKFAEAFSKSAKTTAIYLARIGVDGTSGHHNARKTVLELMLMNAALDAIKQRHGFEGFHIAGQSGGAALVVGLAGMRDDIACAVPGAAQLLPRRAIVRRPDSSLEYFDPSERIPVIARKPSLRLLLVTDPNDKQVSAPNQAAFVQQLRQAGGKVEQFFVEATDEKHHGVVIYSRLVVSGCVRGVSNEDIASQLAKLVEKAVAAKRNNGQGAANANPAPLPQRSRNDARNAPSSERPAR